MRDFNRCFFILNSSSARNSLSKKIQYLMVFNLFVLNALIVEYITPVDSWSIATIFYQNHLCSAISAILSTV